ncbi:hypothetical protein EV2_002795 [Malus domestica]
MVLFATGAFGIWSENNTKIGSALSGALMSTLIELAASNLEIISSNSPVYSFVLEFLFPLAVPLLLYRADWKIAAALTGRHIGGAINYVAISDALGVSPSILACLRWLLEYLLSLQYLVMALQMMQTLRLQTSIL